MHIWRTDESEIAHLNYKESWVSLSKFYIKLYKIFQNKYSPTFVRQGHTVTKTVIVTRLLVTRTATAVCCCCRRGSACRYDCLCFTFPASDRHQPNTDNFGNFGKKQRNSSATGEQVGRRCCVPSSTQYSDRLTGKCQ